MLGTSVVAIGARLDWDALSLSWVALLLVCALQYTFLYLYLQGPAFAPDFTCPVVAVLDGLYKPLTTANS